MKLIITTILMTSLLLSESATRGLLLKSNISPLDIYKNQWALLIGVNEYKEFTPLKYAVEDAKSIKTTLITQYGFPEKNIIFLTDNDATKINIQNAFYDLVEKTSKDDAVIVFFAGHGITRQNPGSKEDLGYLIPIDGKKNNLTRSSLSMKDIKTLSNEVPAKSVLFLVDACYGGLAAAGQYRSDNNLNIIKGLTEDRSRLIITAGKKNEEVLENEKWQHSAFTHVLLDGLQNLKADIDNDGIIMANQLFSYIQTNVLKLTQGGQTPQFNQLTLDEGEFAFIDQNILSNQFDVDFSGFGFLTIPSEPFGALIKINDRLIDKKTPLINEQLEAGYHTISISKKGYKDFAQRIFIKPNETEIISPVMNFIQGIVSFGNIPKSSKIIVDGKLIGTTPLENIVLEKGLHTLEINVPGYEKLPLIDLNIEKSELYPLTLPRLIPKTKSKALMRSSVLPGWGQNYYEKNIKSKGFGITFLLSGLFCIYNQWHYSQLNSKYNLALNDYQTSGVDLDQKANQMISLYDKLLANEKRTNLGLYILGGIYSANLIDIFLEKSLSNTNNLSDVKIKSDLKVGITSNGPGIEIGIKF